MSAFHGLIVAGILSPGNTDFHWTWQTTVASIACMLPAKDGPVRKKAYWGEQAVQERRAGSPSRRRQRGGLQPSVLTLGPSGQPSSSRTFLPWKLLGLSPSPLA